MFVGIFDPFHKLSCGHMVNVILPQGPVCYLIGWDDNPDMVAICLFIILFLINHFLIRMNRTDSVRIIKTERRNNIYHRNI